MGIECPGGGGPKKIRNWGNWYAGMGRAQIPWSRLGHGLLILSRIAASTLHSRNRPTSGCTSDFELKSSGERPKSATPYGRVLRRATRRLARRNSRRRTTPLVDRRFVPKVGYPISPTRERPPPSEPRLSSEQKRRRHPTLSGERECAPAEQNAVGHRDRASWGVFVLTTRPRVRSA